MISTSSIQAVIFLQILSKTTAQFPMPYPPGGQQFMMPGMVPGPPMPSPLPAPSMLPAPMGNHYPLQQKLPVVVMPYYSKESKQNNKKKRRRRQKDQDESSCESDESHSHENNFRRSGKKPRRQVLTPMVSYVTKDGYVVYQKKIKKDRAADWLTMAKDRVNDEIYDDEYEEDDKHGRRRSKHYHHHHVKH